MKLNRKKWTCFQLVSVIFLYLFSSAVFSAVQPNLSLLQSELTVDEQMMLFAKIDIAEKDQVHADLYFRMIIPNSVPYYFNPVTILDEKPFPILKNWLVSAVPEFKLLSFALPEGIPEGKYSWEMLFTKPGGNIDNVNDLLGSHQSTFDFKSAAVVTKKKSLAISADKFIYKKGEKMTLFLESNIEKGQSETFDLYLTLVDPDGERRTLTPQLSLSKDSNRPRPLLKNLTLSVDFKKIPILELDLSGRVPGVPVAQ